MVMDNHRAHLSNRIKDLFKQLQCRPLFLPPASSIFNPIETLWSSVKRRWRQTLIEADSDHLTEAWMIRQLKAILSSFSPREL